MPTRKPDRCLQFTEEALKALPPIDHYMHLWFDTEQTYLTYRNVRDKTPVFMFLLNNSQLTALKAAGKRTGRLINLGDISLEKARQQALTLHDEANALARQNIIPRKARTTPKLEISTDSLVENLLRDAAPKENPNYDSLMSTLMDAYDQARNGKGASRHGAGLNFEDQDMLKIIDAQGTGFTLGQALKKIIEGRRLSNLKARDEYLGAIVYIAGTIVWMDKQEKVREEVPEAEGN